MSEEVEESLVVKIGVILLVIIVTYGVYLIWKFFTSSIG